jgi:hypothetical protein
MKHFIPAHGGYRKLLSYQKAEIVYDATVYFTNRFFLRGNRTIDQMVQAARSGKQNIVEASQASGTSKESEIKLTNVARASLIMDTRPDSCILKQMLPHQLNRRCQQKRVHPQLPP